MTAYPYAPSEFRDVAWVRNIRCAACNGRYLDHGPRGECYPARRDYMPYTMGLTSPTYSAASARRDADAEWEITR